MYFRYLCLVLPFLMTASFLHAAPGVVITLENVPQRVRADHPDLAAARLRIREASARWIQSGRLENPRLEVALEHTPRFNERRAEVGLSQRFPVTNRLALEKSVSRTLIEAAEAEVKEFERVLVEEAMAAVVEVLAVRGRSELLGLQRDGAAEFADRLGVAAERGEASALDAGMARLDAATLEAEIRSVSGDEAAALAKLRPLLGLESGAPVHVAGTLEEPRLPTATGAIARPDLQNAWLRTVAAGQAVAVEEARRREDVEAGVMAAVERAEDAPKGYQRDTFFGIRLQIPLPWWDRNEGNIEEARARHERLRLEGIALEKAANHEVVAAREEMEEWLRVARDVEQGALAFAAEQLQLVEQAVAQGQGDLSLLFRARQQQAALGVARLDAVKRFHLARIRHEAALNRF